MAVRAAPLSHFREHVFSPHQVLLRIRQHLKPDGLLIIHCPVVTFLAGPSLKLATRFKLQRGFHGALCEDHINFFSAKTLRLTCEFAGFRTEYVGTAYLPDAISRWMTRICPVAWYIGRKVKSFQYADGSSKLLDEQGDVAWKI